jgi:hypothetical protein
MRACAQTKPVIMRAHTHTGLHFRRRKEPVCSRVYLQARSSMEFPASEFGKKPAFLCSRSDIRIRVLSVNLQ